MEQSTIERIGHIEQMVSEIYHHLGLDCRKVVSIQTVKEQARKDVLKWQDKRIKMRHEREAS
jgi:hypothetical protein